MKSHRLRLKLIKMHQYTLNAIKLASFPRRRESTTTWKIWIPTFVGM